jgi:inosine-uridine nucleoside N-ribohydrolase
VQQVLAHPGEITLLAIGPLTNLALALQKDERIIQAVREVVVMGGAFSVRGNVTPSAEANVHADPEAAARVFDAGWPLTLVGLDVTERCLTNRAFMQALGQAADPAVRLLGRIFPVYEEYHRREYGLDGGTYIHDPAAVAYVLDRTQFRTVRGRVRVVAEGPHTGRTVLDRSVQQGVCRVCTDVDAGGVLEYLKAHLIGQL